MDTGLKRVDYDEGQHRNYVAGRDLGAAHAAWWAGVLAGHAPKRRPLTVLDLGCGTGRFTAALADAMGEAIGVEPSSGMREQALARPAHPNVRFLEGRAEQIPLPDSACDLVLMFLSFHHVVDREAAGREIARVLRPGGRLILRSPFNDRFPDVTWHAYFPSARAVELQMFPSVAEAEAPLHAAGLRTVEIASVDERFDDSLATHAKRLETRAISTFEHLSEEEVAAGFARLNAAAAAETTPKPIVVRSDILVLERP